MLVWSVREIVHQLAQCLAPGTAVFSRESTEQIVLTTPADEVLTPSRVEIMLRELRTRQRATRTAEDISFHSQAAAKPVPRLEDRSLFGISGRVGAYRQRQHDRDVVAKGVRCSHNRQRCLRELRHRGRSCCGKSGETGHTVVRGRPRRFFFRRKQRFRRPWFFRGGGPACIPSENVLAWR